MINSISLTLGGHKYKAEIGQIVREGIRTGYNFQLFKGSTNVGAINIFISTALNKNWSQSDYNLERDSHWLRNLLIILLPHLDISVDLDLVKNDDGMISFNILFVGDDKSKFENNTLFLPAEWRAEKQIEKIIYDDDVEDEKVEFEILNYLEMCWKEDQQPISVTNLIQALYIDPNITNRVLNYLWDNKQVIINQITGNYDTGKVIITTFGRNQIRKMNSQKNTNPNISVQNGDYVQGSKNTTTGAGSHIIQGSHDFTILSQDIDKFLQQFNDEYDSPDKNDVGGAIDSVKGMIEGGEKVADIIDKSIALLPRIQKYSNLALLWLNLLVTLFKNQ